MGWKVRLNRESYFYELDKHVCITVTELRFIALCLKASTQETSVAWAGKFALLWRLTTWGKGG